MMNRMDYGNSPLDIIVVAGQSNAAGYGIGDMAEEYLKNRQSCDAVLQAIREMMAMRVGAFVETDDLKSNNQQVGNGDDIHFCREALYLLGERMFEAYLQLRNKTI